MADPVEEVPSSNIIQMVITATGVVTTNDDEEEGDS